MDLYGKNTANSPRTETDVCFADYENRAEFSGIPKEALDFVTDRQLLRTDLWKRFVDQFRGDSDANSGWRGEYWGKMMRGACFVYSCTRDAKLYGVLSASVRDMLTAADGLGRISTYGVYHEFEAWDLWCRKYVLLGMQYFLEICAEEDLKKQIIRSMCGQMDYIISKIGRAEEGKKPITRATNNFRGLNSCSLLEPVVRLYSITGNAEYLKFADYIVSCGGTEADDLFELAYRDKLYPYQYPMIKAYEMISCFEGLLEYYRATKIGKYKQSVICFANKLLESDFTIIGGAGCTHEFFDHSSVRQANTMNGFKEQETCVTVTLMKFMYQLTLLTGDPRYADAFEHSYYNAYLGAFNTQDVIEEEIRRDYPGCVAEALPFDSYSPLTAKNRGVGVGGFQIMEGGYYYGCCACIGSAGAGLFLKMALLTEKDGFRMNLYSAGKITSRAPSGSSVTFVTETAYPVGGEVRVRVCPAREEVFTVRFRIPAWSEISSSEIGGEKIVIKDGFASVSRLWRDGDTVTLRFDMRTHAVRPIPYGHQIIMKMNWELDFTVPLYDEEDPMAKHHLALCRGPLVLAQESRLGTDLNTPVSISVKTDSTVDAEISSVPIAPYKNILEMEVPLADGTRMHVTDYASAGKLFSQDNKLAAWMLVKEAEA